MKQKYGNKPLLTLSFLSSGRKKTIQKCLDSLGPIMKALPCELIVVDTGCDEEMLELLHRYANRIIPFEWCNDFAKARNAGLHEASGEWFLYIDDDEWFEDTTDIIAFFKTGEYKNYTWASYIQRNYLDYTQKRWSDVWVSRLIRLDEGTCFVGRIHEYFSPIKGKCKMLHSYVHHFGYVFESEEAETAHSERNISILLELVKTESGNIRWWVHLAQEYFVKQHLDKLQELCLNGLKRFENMNIPSGNAALGTLYLGILMKTMLNQEYEETEKYYHIAVSDGRNTDMCRAMLNARMAEVYYRQKRYEECNDCCEKYLELYTKLCKDADERFEQGVFFVHDACEPNVRNLVYSFYLKCCIEKNCAKGFISSFYGLGWNDDIMNMYSSTVDDIIDGFTTLPYTDEFVKMAQTMMDRNGINRLTIERLQQIEREDKEKFAALYRIFEQVDSPAIIKNPKPVQQKLTITPEMQQLATQIKGQIQVLLGQGLYKEANAVLAQLKTFVPIDEEMAAMEQQITNNLSSI